MQLCCVFELSELHLPFRIRMKSTRRHIAFFLLSLLLFMQLPVQFLHIGHEEMEHIPVDVEKGEALGQFVPSCSLCDLVFPPVIQAFSAVTPAFEVLFSPFAILQSPPTPFLSLELCSLRAPPLV